MNCYRWIPKKDGGIFLARSPGGELIAHVFRAGVAWGWQIGRGQELLAVGFIPAGAHHGTANTAVQAGKRVMDIIRRAGEALDHQNSAFRRLCHLRDADQAHTQTEKETP